MWIERFDDLDIHRVVTPEEAAALERGFVDTYRRIFAQPPYFEDFTDAEAVAHWRRLCATRHAIVLVALDATGAVAGFGVAIPLSADGPATRALSGLVPAKATMYLVELGVDEAWRGRGLARHLVKLRIRLIDADLYSHVVLRVAEGRTASFEMYRSLEFEDMGVAMEVERRRTDGSIRRDTRHFLSRVLSQVRLDAEP